MNCKSPKNNKGTSTDESGKFDWKGELLPSDTIEISYVGFQTQRILAEKLATCPDIILQFNPSSFVEVIVKEYITAGIEQSEKLDHLILRPNQIDVVPGLTEADVLQMVQILPGVQSPDESATGLHIRGGTPDQNLISLGAAYLRIIVFTFPLMAVGMLISRILQGMGFGLPGLILKALSLN